MPLRLSDFHYDLPPERIAQEPLPRRDASRLMILRAKNEQIEHAQFGDISRLLQPGDVLVLNDTRVMPARLIGHKPSGGKIEVLLLRRLSGSASDIEPARSPRENKYGTAFEFVRKTNSKTALDFAGVQNRGAAPNNSREGGDWKALVHPSGKFKQGAEISVGGNGFHVKALDEHESGAGFRTVRLRTDSDRGWKEELERLGHMPLPPYIKRADGMEDRNRYQTVFAKNDGAAAAPTAGLHFTPELLSDLERKGIQIAYITLHVGYGTFKPVASELLEEHKMHEEYFCLSDETAAVINARRRLVQRHRAVGAANGRFGVRSAQRGRLVACGTTSLRALESAVRPDGSIEAREGETKLFIYPPYEFRTADALITNFHLPKSTLLMLTSAFGGHEFVRRAYEEAIRRNYRFYSYGDAMFIER